jgi:hypothetical protein
MAFKNPSISCAKKKLNPLKPTKQSIPYPAKYLHRVLGIILIGDGNLRA